MARVFTGHRVLRLVGAVVAYSVLCGAPRPAGAVEFADGRVQIHGFGEMQVRALDEKFSEELDLAQWYNVLNLEIELDIAPNGIGPFDLISGFVRAEARYDALYSQGFGMFPSINTYGNDAERLPKRLRDAVDRSFGGTIRTTQRNFIRFTEDDPDTPQNEAGRAIVENQFEHPRIEDERPAPLAPRSERTGFPGLGTFFRLRGPDNISGGDPRPANRGVLELSQPFDDPAYYIHERVLDYRFALQDRRGPANNNTLIMGPWLPKNEIRAIALTADRGNPFRGRIAPTRPRELGAGFVFRDSESAERQWACLGSDCPRRATDAYGVADDTVAVLDPKNLPLITVDHDGDPLTPETAVVDRLAPLMAQILDAPDTVTSDVGGVTLNTAIPGLFGGDFMGGIVPCVDPTKFDENSSANQLRQNPPDQAPPVGAACIRGSSNKDGDFEPGDYVDPRLFGVTKITGGGGEAPFRPAPDLSNLGQVRIDAAGNVIEELPDSADLGYTVAQGLYIPSKGLVQEIRGDSLDQLNFNYSETERAWNRGDSQERTKELKEAYLDIELMESRLWLRLGLQSIVWGKTELFRTTDQFNPQDLALASLPSLEESRVSLWSARAVYSLYDVGALEDVRLELAANIDEYQNADLGACGEPFTPDLVCALTTGFYAHSLLGIGVAGVDRPESPWTDLSDLEIGGRIEWRWDRFSFALTDFYGYSDFPYPDAIFYYERAIDHESGRPLVARLPGETLGTCGVANAGQVRANPQAGNIAYSTSYASHPFSMTPGIRIAVGGGADVRGGIGRDRDCLRPGGAPGGTNSFLWDEEEDDLANTNALQNHHANQQIFAWICAGTIGIGASLDPSSCAWTVFSSGQLVQSQFFRVPFVEVLTSLWAGEQTGGNLGPQQFLGQVQSGLKGPFADTTAPFTPTNRLFNDPQAPIIDRGLYLEDGSIDPDAVPAFDASDCGDDSTPEARALAYEDCDLRGFDAFDTRVNPEGAIQRDRTPLTLDSSLTNEQRALLGCGPFWGTRCDSSFKSGFYGAFGGLDFMNMEASALVQSWPGFEGTFDGHDTTAGLAEPGTLNAPGAERLNQPGTVGFVGGPVCTRFVPELGGTVKLPGCRGVSSLTITTGVGGDPSAVVLDFEEGYMPSVDGCVIGSRAFDPESGEFVPVVATIAGQSMTAEEAAEFELCNQSLTRQRVPEIVLQGFGVDGNPIVADNGACTGTPSGWVEAIPDGPVINHRLCIAEDVPLDMLPMIHPTAGCVDSPVWWEAKATSGVGGCEFFHQRDLASEFFNGTAALFQNELAAFSWNFLQFLAASSCSATAFDLDGIAHTQQSEGNIQFPSAQTGLREDDACFDAENPWQPGRCSFSTPQFCTNVQGFLSAAGVRRNVVRAAGNGRFGRRTFVWHGGGEAVLRYDQRNVFGFSTDFAEDNTGTSWGVEFTWIEGVPFTDNDSMNGISYSDTYNLTISVDRPTFINFLNPNRTFFFNSQWFFNYIADYEGGYTFNGPLNVLFTFAVFTGYFQDRLNPQFVTVYDFHSKSGGLLPSLQYRFTESFSVTIGLNYFFGRTRLIDMPVRDLAPPSNRAGPDAYRAPVDNLLSAIRKRDEVYLRLRYTF